MILALLATAAVSMNSVRTENCKAMRGLQDAIESWNASFHEHPAYATDAPFRASVATAERQAEKARRAVETYCRGGERKAP